MGVLWDSVRVSKSGKTWIFIKAPAQFYLFQERISFIVLSEAEWRNSLIVWLKEKTMQNMSRNSPKPSSMLSENWATSFPGSFISPPQRVWGDKRPWERGLKLESKAEDSKTRFFFVFTVGVTFIIRFKYCVYFFPHHAPPLRPPSACSRSFFECSFISLLLLFI